MAYHSIHDKRDEHFLRKFFDTLYDITPEHIQGVYTSIPKRTKWMFVTTVAALILVVIAFQLAKVGVEAIEWANRTSLAERLAAPYDLNLHAVPVVDTGPLQGRELRMVNGAAIEQERRAAIEAAYAALPLVDEAAVVEVAEAVAAVPAPAVDEAAIRALIQPQVDPAYFAILPEINGFVRSYIYDNVQVHPSLSCIVTAEEPETLPCGLNTEPLFFEAADYADTSNQLVRIAAAQYPSNASARESLTQLFRHSRTVGTLGNYAITETNPVGYFYATAGGWRVFTWSHYNWVFTVSAQSIPQIESIVQNFPY